MSSSNATKVSLASVCILATFLIYFIFCYAAHLLTSRVERVHLPKITQPKSWALQSDDVYAVITDSKAQPGSDQSFCRKLQTRIAEIDGANAPTIHCIFQQVQLLDSDPGSIDLSLKEHSSSKGLTWFFLRDTNRQYSTALGQYNHSWTIQGQLDEDEWIDKSLSIFNRMVVGAPVGSSGDTQSQKNYLLSFSVLVEDPAEAKIDWNMKQVIDDYLQPFLETIRPVFNTRVDSQIIYYADIADHVQVTDTGSSFLSQSQLEDFMGRTRWNVESIHTPSHPALHFFIYIPLTKHSPLFIHSDYETSMAFCIPRWGGLSIANSLAKPRADAEDFSSVMPVVLAQIRMLLGFPSPLWASYDPKEALQVPSKVGVADWEVRLIQRQRLQRNYYEGYNKLHALMLLLDEKHQLPVQSHVGSLIEQAVSNLDQCMHNAESGLYDKAYDLCLDGYIAAYSAFFDETMLPLLYFPDEHIYAVYAPYFLSIFSVTISRTLQFIKSLRRKNGDSVSISQ